MYDRPKNATPTEVVILVVGPPDNPNHTAYVTKPDPSAVPPVVHSGYYVYEGYEDTPWVNSTLNKAMQHAVRWVSHQLKVAPPDTVRGRMLKVRLEELTDLAAQLTPKPTTD